jgi:hypothetical protein
MRRREMPRKNPPKQPPRPIITHTFPPARPDDRERFVALVRMLMKLGDRPKQK